MEPELKIYDDAASVTQAFANHLAQWIKESQNPLFHVALSGGSTPKRLFRHLAERYKDAIEWNKVHFWWGDERMVSPDDDESNYKMTRELLFSRIDIPEDHIHRIRGEKDPPTESVRYADEIEFLVPEKETWPAFDLILLGMGDDGHTASIFPNQMELLHSLDVCEVATHPSSGQKRITLTGKVLNNAAKTAFLVTGENKADRLREIFTDPDKGRLLPAFHIHPEGELYWFVDQAAAGKLEKK
jgi:6-phosphogluconolactonase